MLNNLRAQGFNAAIALLVSMTGCGLESGTQDAGLTGRTFLLDSSQGFELMPGTTLRLSFDADADEATFSADCNFMGGDYEIHDRRLTFSSFGRTEAGCLNSLHAQDDTLQAFFLSEPQLTLHGDRLTLIGQDAMGNAVTLVFLDREIADPDRPLIGTQWNIDTLIQNGGASFVPPGPVIVFEDNGLVSIDGLCVPGSGELTVNGDTLTLTGFSFLGDVCGNGSTDLFAPIEAVLADGQVTFEIEADLLSLRRDDIGLDAHAE